MKDFCLLLGIPDHQNVLCLGRESPGMVGNDFLKNSCILLGIPDYNINHWSPQADVLG